MKKKTTFKAIPPPADPRYPEANKLFQPTAAPAHTPPPWESYRYGTHCTVAADNGNYRVADYIRNQADAAFIVRACNSHAPNVAALRAALALLQDPDAEPADADRVTAQIESALKGEPAPVVLPDINAAMLARLEKTAQALEYFAEEVPASRGECASMAKELRQEIATTVAKAKPSA